MWKVCVVVLAVLFGIGGCGELEPWIERMMKVKITATAMEETRAVESPMLLGSHMCRRPSSSSVLVTSYAFAAYGRQQLGRGAHASIGRSDAAKISLSCAHGPALTLEHSRLYSLHSRCQRRHFPRKDCASFIQVLYPAQRAIGANSSTLMIHWSGVRGCRTDAPKSVNVRP